MFLKFWKEEFDWGSIIEVRDRLILAWRFLGLFRSVDLSRVCRTIALSEGALYVKVGRKQRRQYYLEKVMCLDDRRISPAHVLERYVTKHIGNVGGPLLLTANRPHTPLTADSIGSITRRHLKRLGVDISAWRPHTTRGAFVDFYKRLELPSEVVAQIGWWKNVDAFSRFYLRLGAVDQAAEKVEDLVHKA